MAEYKHGYVKSDGKGDEYFYISEVQEDGSLKEVFRTPTSLKGCDHRIYREARREYIEKLSEYNEICSYKSTNS